MPMLPTIFSCANWFRRTSHDPVYQQPNNSKYLLCSRPTVTPTPTPTPSVMTTSLTIDHHAPDVPPPSAIVTFMPAATSAMPTSSTTPAASENNSDASSASTLTTTVPTTSDVDSVSLTHSPNASALSVTCKSIAPRPTHRCQSHHTHSPHPLSESTLFTPIHTPHGPVQSQTYPRQPDSPQYRHTKHTPHTPQLSHLTSTNPPPPSPHPTARPSLAA
ncbi:hypothetical protein SprV_0301227500 [Sparganum proliferum]